MVSENKGADSFGKWLVIIISIIFIMYPVTSFVFQGIRTGYLIILLLLSAVGISYYWQEIKRIELSRIEKWFLVSYLMMFVTTLASVVIFGEGADGGKRIEVYSAFIISIPVYYLYRLYRPSHVTIWAAIVVACFVVATRAWLELNGLVEELAWKSFPSERANGTMHPIRFGDLALLMAFISLAGSLYIKNIKVWLKYAGYSAFACGIYASILSQSRGGWVAFPVMAVVVLWPIFRSIQLKRKIAVFASIIIGVLLVYNTAGLKVGERVNHAISDLTQYQNNKNSRTSIGSRFDMYETAYHIFLRKPLFGVGVGNYRESAASYYQEHAKRMSTEVKNWGNPHNEILGHMATRGIVGLVVLLGFFVIGMYLFGSRIRHADPVMQFYAISGLLVYIAYFQFGLSIALFEHRDFTLFFVLYVTLFAAGMGKNNNTVQ